MIKVNTISDYLEKVRQNNLLLTESAINAIYEEVDQKDNTEVHYFQPVGQQVIDGGIRYYEVNTNTKPSQIRYIDITHKGISKPSKWISVYKENDDIIYTDENNNSHTVSNIEYIENMVKIALPLEKKSILPSNNEYSVWMCQLSYVDTQNNDKWETKKIAGIYTNQQFPKRNFLDKLRNIMDARVSVSNKNGVDVITAKKKSNDDYKVLHISRSLNGKTTTKEGIAKLMSSTSIPINTPDDFLTFLRNTI